MENIEVENKKKEMVSRGMERTGIFRILTFLCLTNMTDLLQLNNNSITILDCRSSTGKYVKGSETYSVIHLPRYRSTASKGFLTICFSDNTFSEASGKRAAPEGNIGTKNT